MLRALRAAFVAALVAPATPAAADISAMQSTLYLRAGTVVDMSDGARFTDAACARAAPVPLYGCGRGNDGAPLSTLGNFSTAGGVELGLGLAAAPGVRIEAVFGYRPRFSFAGRANFSQLAPDVPQRASASLSSLSGMVAAYLDLAAVGAPRLGPVAPFVGAGVGAARIAVRDMRLEFPRTVTLVPDGERTGFAWTLTAGISAALGRGAALDVAWRYTDHGSVETGHGTGLVVWRDSSRAPLPLPDLGPTRANLRSHSLAVSLRRPF